MRLCTFREYAGYAAGVVSEGRVVGLDDLNEAWGQDFGPDLGQLIKRGQVEDLERLLSSDRTRPTSGWRPERLRYAAPYRNPPKIWCVGMNYAARADAEGDTAARKEPASCMRPATTIADPDQEVPVPTDVGKVQAEGEIAVIMGKRLKDAASAEEARDAVLGFTLALDVTAKDLVNENPKWLTRAKSFDQFLPLGPMIVTKDDWEPTPDVRVSTSLNGDVVKDGTVESMLHSPYDLVATYSRVFTWEPGDILITGSPGATPVTPGDVVTAEATGLGKLENRISKK